ncbi:MAG: cupredoxin family copper-binding protein [Firmicutes bacterium]|nr:cupredoxin family copper-binding protein [Bacillota bacterium]
MKKRLLLVLLVFGLMLTLASCSSPTPTPTAPAPTPTPAGGSTVSIESFAFKPAVLTVPAGTTVVWTNNDSVGHNIKATDFSSNILAKGETFSFKFDKAGTYDYSCGIHPTMTGKIVVQ